MSIRRTIGKRKYPEGSLEPKPPTDEEIRQDREKNLLPLRVPKGVFRYKSHEEANKDWERWMTDTVLYNFQRHKGHE